jgi:hypothetical protein
MELAGRRRRLLVLNVAIPLLLTGALATAVRRTTPPQ